MSIISWFRRRKGLRKDLPEPDARSSEPHLQPSDIVRYVTAIWSGERAPDAEFEQRTLSEVGFNSVRFAEVLFQIARHQGVPLERVVEFLLIGIPGGGDEAIATLVERIEILANEFEEGDRIKLLESGVVGDKREVLPINRGLDQIGLAVKMCKAVALLGQLKDHDAIEAEYGSVTDDPDWKRPN